MDSLRFIVRTCFGTDIRAFFTVTYMLMVITFMCGL